MKKIILVILLLVSNQLLAVWSGFAHVTPETEGEFELVVKIKLIKQEGKYQVKFKIKEDEFKSACFLYFAMPLSLEEQEAIRWDENPAPKKRMLLQQCLKAKKINDFLYYEVEFSKEQEKSSYIYIGYSPIVADGGFYYSIDIPAYISKGKYDVE